jgi:DNA repair/transcription protein MET18/MMS19
MAKLPDSDADGHAQYMTTLDGLARLGAEKGIFEVLLRRLLNKLDAVLTNCTSSAYPHAILSTLLYAVSQQQLEHDANLEMYYDRLVVGLIRKVVSPIRREGPPTLLNDVRVTEVVGRMSNLVVRSLSYARQEEMKREIYGLFSPDAPQRLDIQSLSDDQRRCSILSTDLLAGIKREVTSTIYRDGSG